MQSTQTRIYSFDVTRALAAFLVVLLHWSEYTVSGFAPPFERYFEFFYQFGALAVPMFFVLSGFIFDWLYSHAIERREINAFKFFILRISRLYPLFIITFIAVAVEVSLSSSQTGYTFDSLYTDDYHALLNILMMSGWGLEKGFSFNGPSWTVSTEIFLYGAFFIVARIFRIRPLTIAVMLAVGIIMMPVSVHLGGGLVQFFTGVSAHRLFLLWSRRRSRGWIVAAAVGATVLIMLYWYEYRTQAGLALLRSTFPSLPKIDTRYQIIRDMTFPAVAFPMIAFIQAALENISARREMLGHPLVTWAGNISYSLYLWHYPLMIAFAFAAVSLGASKFLFYSPGILALYLVVLFGTSHASYYLIERPMMRAIRARFVPSDRGARAGMAGDAPLG